MIEVDGIEKHFGPRRALGPIALRVRRGEVVGLLGLNGAGKTTALRVLAGELAPTAGRASVDGIDLASGAARARIGWAPALPPLDPDASVAEQLVDAARLRGLGRDRARAATAEVLRRTGLDDVAARSAGGLSHGVRQRVGVALAIVHGPAVVLLDEPGSGLDPLERASMRRLVRALGEDHAVVIASHLLAEVRAVCDRAVVLAEGTIVADAPIAELDRGPGQRVEVVVDGDVALASRSIAAVEGVTSVAGVDGAAEATLEVEAERDVRAAVARALVGAGVDLLEVRSAGDGLDRAFVALARGGEG